MIEHANPAFKPTSKRSRGLSNCPALVLEAFRLKVAFGLETNTMSLSTILQPDGWESTVG
jgi:hypothetical protein